MNRSGPANVGNAHRALRRHLLLTQTTSPPPSSMSLGPFHYLRKETIKTEKCFL
jgi:hypothetical protein